MAFSITIERMPCWNATCLTTACDPSDTPHETSEARLSRTVRKWRDGRGGHAREEEKMPYRKIEVDTKVAAVERVLRGEKLSYVVREMGLDRNSLSSWVRRALFSIRQGLSERRNGPAPRQVTAMVSVRAPGAPSGSAGRIEEKPERPAKAPAEGPAPERCIRCGCGRFYRNGYSMMDLGNILGVSLSNSNRKIPVQKFTCVNCGKNARLEGRRALYHWVASGKNPCTPSFLSQGRAKRPGRRGQGRPGVRVLAAAR